MGRPTRPTDTTGTCALAPGVRYVTLCYDPQEEAIRRRIRALNEMPRAAARGKGGRRG